MRDCDHVQPRKEMATMFIARTIRALRGTQITFKSWLTKAPMRIWA
jgi:hypothetical protein